MALSRRDLIKAGAISASTMIVSKAQALQDSKPADHVNTTSGPDHMPLDRMPEIPLDKMTEAQKKAAAEFLAGRHTPVFGPFIPLLRSPEVMLRAMAMGDYLRYKSVLPPAISEFVILITSRHWTQQYEWAVHYPIAIKAGLKPETAKAVNEGRRPQGMSLEEEIIYDFCTELHANQSVCDATYARALAKYGEQGIIDMVSLNGYYTFLAMVLNVARTALPKGSAPELQGFPQ